ncbi:MAG: DUF3667 domain-containing protein [Candidatus Delongbacteria bacterium]|nr:DUF3667 domain-containing protein [Candidatus Delongbacteria bacterium]MBN2835454.1 DUF3667 domain-containing protein [Candidatus Delongbacteria bacterium]
MICRNCGNECSNNFCSHCGQRTKEPKKNFKELVDELFDNFIDFDKVFFLTIKKLLISPAFLTKEYLTGRRVKYVNPFRLFIMLSFIFFMAIYIENNSENYYKVYSQLSEKLSADSIDFDDLRSSLNTDSTDQNEITVFDSATQVDFFNFHSSTNEEVKFDKKKLMDNFQSNIPIALFLLMPLTALYLKILYIRRKRYYLEHLIFSLHLHSFSFLIFMPLPYLNDEYSAIVRLILLHIYLLIAFKRFYGQSKLMTFVKFSLFMILQSLSIGVTLLITLVITFLPILIF